MPNSLRLRNHITCSMKITSRKKMVEIWLKFSPVLPYLLDTLYCAVVNFPVSGSCTVARLSYKKKKEKGQGLTHVAGNLGLLFVLFCQATGDWKDSDWSGWWVMVSNQQKHLERWQWEKPLPNQEKMGWHIFVEDLLSFHFF